MALDKSWVQIELPNNTSLSDWKHMMLWCEYNLGEECICWKYNWGHSSFLFISENVAAEFCLAWL